MKRRRIIFFDSDAARGISTMPSMVAEGYIIGPNTGLAMARKAKARAWIDKGPPPLDAQDMLRRRYGITDLLYDLKDERPAGEVTACLCKLYGVLGDFYLRAAGLWSGEGKGLYKRLKTVDPAFATRFDEAFRKGFGGDTAPVQSLILDIIEPYGGTHWENDCQMASPAWKSYKKADIPKP